MYGLERKLSASGQRYLYLILRQDNGAYIEWVIPLAHFVALNRSQVPQKKGDPLHHFRLVMSKGTITFTLTAGHEADALMQELQEELLYADIIPATAHMNPDQPQSSGINPPYHNDDIPF
jgi:hypothetical protein